MVHCFQEYFHVLIATFMYQPQLGFCLDGTNYKLLPELCSGQLRMGSHLDMNKILVEYLQLRITDMFADHQIFITPCPWSILCTFRIMWSTAFIKDRRMHLLEGRWLLVERGITYLDTNHTTVNWLFTKVEVIRYHMYSSWDIPQAWWTFSRRMHLSQLKYLNELYRKCNGTAHACMNSGYWELLSLCLSTWEWG